MEDEREAQLANLEKLAHTRTEQLRQCFSEKEELQRVLKEIRGTLSAENLRLVDAALEKTRHEADSVPFFQKTSSVPKVDPDDLKAAWKIYCDEQDGVNGAQSAISIRILERVCKPGADVEAVAYRVMMLFVPEFANQLLPPEGRRKFAPLDDAQFERYAICEMSWPRSK
jgi:hypothetical protein